MELDEEVEKAAMRELFEETDFLRTTCLFGVFSGKILHYTYPNGDEVSNIDIVYLCRSYSGDLTPQASEVSELRFFSASEMPPENELTPPNRPVLKRYIESLAEC